MAENIKTHLYCFDVYRGFSEDIRKRFSDQTRYSVVSFPDRETFIKHLVAARESDFCKIAIIVLHDVNEQSETINQLTTSIKKIDRRTGLILVAPADKMEAIKKAAKFNIDAYVPKNSNSVLRIHNTVKKLISEHSLNIFKRKANISVYILIAFLLLSFGIILAAYFKMPQYF